jgi:guanine deaminase
MSGQDLLSAHRGEILHCTGNPFHAGIHAVEHIPDGLLMVDRGRIVACGPADDLLPRWQAQFRDQSAIVQHPGLLVPGFIDCHVHYPQLDIIGSPGKTLLDWLERYTFPAERALADPAHAQWLAERFLQAVLKRGTTTAMVYGTVHPHSVDVFFQQALARDLRMICGKPLMDRNAPDYLRDTAEQGIRDTRDLIERWHHRGRLAYAVTPRFAPSSTPLQLQLAGELRKTWPDLYIQTHLAETREEVAWVKTLFPDIPTYLDVYDRAGLIGDHTMLGHCIYLEDTEWTLLKARDARIAHCPSSNFFLGSGLFDAARARAEGICFALGSDVGAGTSLSMLDTAGDAYLTSALQGNPLYPAELFYLITLGGAQALNLDTQLGNFAVGKEADFIEIAPADAVIDPMGARSTPADPLERLFQLAITKQGTNAVTSVFIKGVKQ